MDEKEKQLIKHYMDKISKRAFDEYDVLGLLILVRFVSGLPKLIRDYGDLVAHRERDRGIAHESILNSMNNHYETNDKGQVIGYNGASAEEWEEAWNDFASQWSCNLSHDCIREIVICIMSLSQFSRYVNKAGDIYGEMMLSVGNGGKLALVTREVDDSKSLRVCFTVLEDFTFIEPERYSETGYLINEPVEAVRECGLLRLKTPSGYLY